MDPEISSYGINYHKLKQIINNVKARIKRKRKTTKGQRKRSKIVDGIWENDSGSEVETDEAVELSETEKMVEQVSSNIYNFSGVTSMEVRTLEDLFNYQSQYRTARSEKTMKNRLRESLKRQFIIQVRMFENWRLHSIRMKRCIMLLYLFQRFPEIL